VNAPLFLCVLIKRLWQRLNSLKSRDAIMVVFRIAAISLARHEIAERRSHSSRSSTNCRRCSEKPYLNSREACCARNCTVKLTSQRFSLFQIIHTNTKVDSEKATFTSRIRFRLLNSFYFARLTLYYNISSNNYTVMYADGRKSKSINFRDFYFCASHEQCKVNCIPKTRFKDCNAKV